MLEQAFPQLAYAASRSTLSIPNFCIHFREMWFIDCSWAINHSSFISDAYTCISQSSAYQFKSCKLTGQIECPQEWETLLYTSQRIYQKGSHLYSYMSPVETIANNWNKDFWSANCALMIINSFDCLIQFWSWLQNTSMCKLLPFIASRRPINQQ